MKKFEYSSIRIPREIPLVEELNVHGEAGWEVVDLEIFRNFAEVIFMREISSVPGEPEKIKHNHSVTRRCVIYGDNCPALGTPQEIR